MIHPWPGGDQLLLSAWPNWAPKHVLEEYEGPRLIVHERGGRDYLGLVVDHDDNKVRWIFTPVSPVELRGLMHHGETLRSAILKDRVFVVDYDAESQSTAEVSEIDGDNIPESALPAVSALMPSYLKAAFPLTEEQRARPYFDLQSATGRGLPFGDISAITSQMQAVWATIARSLNIANGQLAATSGGSGSVRVFVDTPPEQFGRIAAVYRDLALALGNPALLARQIQIYDRVPIAAFAKYLSTIKKHDVEVLAQSEQQAAFLGPHAAERAMRVVPEAVALTRPPEVDTSPQAITLDLHGYFENFWRGKKTGKFEFYDLLTAKTYTGPLAPRLMASLRPDEFAMVLGRVTLKRYYATVTVTYVAPDKEKYTLQDYAPVTPLKVI
ncbi:MAG: hypothetical protein ACREEK_28165 [Bradyrhizobium sp.]